MGLVTQVSPGGLCGPCDSGESRWFDGYSTKHRVVC